MTTQADKGKAFRDLHAREGCFVIPNPWDVGTTRILTAKGFEALATTSAGFAFAMGRPESAVPLERDECMAHFAEICAATHLPVSADMQSGYGDDPETVAETIAHAARAGLVGGSIEDATGDSESPVYDFGHAVERIAAAAEAARKLDFPFTLTARAENYLFGITDLDDTIARLKAFEEAGADVLYAPALRDIGTIRDICEAVTKPVNALMTIPGVHLSVPELAAAGVKRISVGSGLQRAAYGEVLRAIDEMQEKETFTYGDRAATFPELTELMTER